MKNDLKPIRQAGESLREKLNDMWDDIIIDNLTVGFVVIMMLVGIWLSVLQNYTVRHALILTILGCFYLLWLCFRFRQKRKVFRAYKKGMFGERFVEEQLDEIRKAGFDVFHDFILKDDHGRENIDHIIVGPSGVFTLETKNWKGKGVPQDDRIVYDGEQLKIGTWVQEDKFLKQPRRQAAKLQAILQPEVKERLWVVPILCFWDRYVQLTRFNPNGLQVVNQRGIGSFVLSREPRLSPETVRKITTKLKALNRVD